MKNKCRRIKLLESKLKANGTVKNRRAAKNSTQLQNKIEDLRESKRLENKSRSHSLP